MHQIITSKFIIKIIEIKKSGIEIIHYTFQQKPLKFVKQKDTLCQLS